MDKPFIKNPVEAYEKLKEENKKFKADLLDQEAETLKAGGVIHKLEKTLTEIKEICGIGIVNGLSEEQYLLELREWQAQILQKISEVIDD